MHWSSPASLILGTLTAQGVAALVLAVLVNVFHRHYGKAYLRHWASSWWALAVFILATFLLRNADLERADTLLLLGVQGVAGYLNIGMLALGFWELIKGRPARTPFVRWFVAGLVAGGALLSAGVALISWEGALANVFALRAFVASAVFVPMALWMFRRRLHESGIGVILAAGSLFVYGLHQVQYAGYHLFGRAPGYALLLGYGEILLLVLLGFGMVSCLLEEERRAAFLSTQQIEHVAYHDALTGLPNRPLFLDRLIVALAQAARYDYKLAVFFLDVDHFKDINDTYGHDAGDEVLRQLGALAREAAGGRHIAARYGGDELVFVMPSLTLPHATDAALAWHGRVASQDFWLDREHRTSVTVSIGVAEGHAAGARSPEDLLRLADAALYDAKRTGRNRVVTYEAGSVEDGEQRVA